ncbi:MAG: DUF3891 family protein [Cyclobacteriaceae bacterium]
MIVKRHNKGWEIFFHRAHALLAMKLALSLDDKYWKAPEFRAEGLSGITEHDDGQQEWIYSKHLNEANAPLDYRDEDRNDLTQAEKVVNNALHKSTFIALMVSRHCHELYKDLDTKKTRQFIDDQKALRKKLRQHLQMKKKTVNDAYDYLRWCDELSLLLCQGDIPGEGRKIDIGRLPDAGMVSVSLSENNTYRLHPWCFRDQEVTFTVEYFVVEQLTFRNDKELKNSFDLAAPLVQKFTFVKD